MTLAEQLKAARADLQKAQTDHAAEVADFTAQVNDLKAQLDKSAQDLNSAQATIEQQTNDLKAKDDTIKAKDDTIATHHAKFAELAKSYGLEAADDTAKTIEAVMAAEKDAARRALVKTNEQLAASGIAPLNETPGQSDAGATEQNTPKSRSAREAWANVTVGS
ncbi:MAG: hypothetical protein ABQ298_03730 [Puniceicoccaceae bacterium]